MARHFTGAVALLLTLLAYAPIHAQEPNSSERRRIEALQLFHHGRAKQATDLLQGLVRDAPSLIEASVLRRDILEICATAYDWNCVGRTLRDMQPALRSERRLAWLYPEAILYEAKLAAWNDDKGYFKRVLETGGPHRVVEPGLYPSAYAELQLLLHDYHKENDDFDTAEQSLSATVMGLLLTDTGNSYAVTKIILDLIAALIQGQDVPGAMQLAELSEPFISRSLNPASIRYAEYQMLLAHLSAYTYQHAATAAHFERAAQLLGPLEIDDGLKRYHVAVANSAATAALLLGRRPDDAKAVHARHPLHSSKAEILSRDGFRNATEFFYALSDVLVGAISGSGPDLGWQRFFEDDPGWKVADRERINIDSYRNLALGLLALTQEKSEHALGLLKRATAQRIDRLDAAFRGQAEGFPLANLVDKLAIELGLAAALESGDQHSLELMLKGSEVLNRNLRHELVDVASVLAAQPDAKSRKDAHSYAHLIQQKRSWELDKLRKLLAGELTRDNSGALVLEYTRVTSTLNDLKKRIRDERRLADTRRLPALGTLRERMRDGQAFIAYFPHINGFGKLCVTRSGAAIATGSVGPDAKRDMRLLAFAVTAGHGADPVLDAQFPVGAAMSLQELLFGGLDVCLQPGMHITVALPPQFADVPLGALLREAPPRQGDGYDLRKARWLIKDVSFSLVVSARHHLATTRVEREQAPRPFLGIGDPLLDAPKTAQLASTAAFRGSLKPPNGIADFAELPETAEELKTVAGLSNAGTSDVLLRGSATEEGFRARPLGEYDVIHFATHGLLKEEIPGLTESALIMTPATADDTFDDGILSASEVSRLNLRARLVVLSACNTARYDMAQASRGVQDLQTAFTIAGAPTLLASLWPVESSVARDLTIRFYREWRSPERYGAAETLARATRAFLAQSDGPRQHPRFWAPFVILGNGAVDGVLGARGARPSAVMRGFEEFASGGEVIHATFIGSDSLLSMQGKWDGQRMSSIISRRGLDGREKWAVVSREIGTGRVSVHGGVAYALGHAVDADSQLIPVARSIDAEGRLRWKSEFPALRGYVLADSIATKEGITIVAIPQSVHTGRTGTGVVLSLAAATGALRARSSFEIGPSGIRLGPTALLTAARGRLIVAVNEGGVPQVRPEIRTPLGLPAFCMEGAATRLIELEARSLRVLGARSIAHFRPAALVRRSDELFLGGETLEECSSRGRAAVLRIDKTGEPRSFWKDDGLFASALRGMDRVDGGIIVAVNNERALGIEATKPIGALMSQPSFRRRWSDDATSAREATLLRLSKGGAVVGARELSAGVGIHLQGVSVQGEHMFAYGALGGVPAMTRQ